jgi:FKBP-type peptidyl-prolyl cis-trans isomerase
LIISRYVWQWLIIIKLRIEKVSKELTAIYIYICSVKFKNEKGMKKLIFLGMIALMFTACNKDDVDQSVVDDEAIQNYISDNGLTMEKLGSGIYYSINVEGAGEAPESNSAVEVKYTGALLDGAVFDETAEDTTAIFSIGNLISGWQYSLPQLKEGGKGTFIIPSQLGYGSQIVGGGVIPSNSVLVFEIELLKIFENQAQADSQIIQNYLSYNELEATAHESGIYYIITEEGEGEHPGSDAIVDVKYTGKLTRGAVFDATAEGATATFALADLIEGWQIGIPLLKPGGKGTFLVPSALAYGERGAGSISPNTVLVFEIELVGFE